MSCKNYKHGFHNYTSLACYVPVALWSATVQIVFASFMMEKKNLPGDAYHIWQHCQFVGKDLRQTTFPRLCSSNIERSDVQGDFCLVTQTTYLRYTVYTSGNWLISHLRKRIIIFISSLVIRICEFPGGYCNLGYHLTTWPCWPSGASVWVASIA